MIIGLRRYESMAWRSERTFIVMHDIEALESRAYDRHWVSGACMEQAPGKLIFLHPHIPSQITLT